MSVSDESETRPCRYMQNTQVRVLSLSMSMISRRWTGGEVATLKPWPWVKVSGKLSVWEREDCLSELRRCYFGALETVNFFFAPRDRCLGLP